MVEVLVLLTGLLHCSVEKRNYQGMQVVASKIDDETWEVFQPLSKNLETDGNDRH